MKSVKKKLNSAKVPARLPDPEWIQAMPKLEDRSYYRKLFYGYCDGTLKAFQLKEYRDASGSKETKLSLPMRCSARALAIILNKKYGAKSGNGSTHNFHAKEILLWVKNKGMPPPGVNNLFITRDAIKWVETNIIGGSSGTTETGTFMAGESAKNEMSVVRLGDAKMLYEERKRKFDARWMLSEAHDFWCDNVGTAVILSVDDLAERKIPSATVTVLKANVTDAALLEKLINALRPIYALLFEEWQQEFSKKIVEIDSGCQEMSEQKKAKLKVKLK